MNAPDRAGRRSVRRRAMLWAAAAVTLPLAATAARAQSIWINPNSGNWSNAANWSGGVPSFNGSQFEVLTFNSAAAPLYVANNDLGFNHQVNTLVFDNNGPGVATLGGNPLMMASSGSGAQIGQEGTAPALINQDVNFFTPLTLKMGPGELTFAGGFGKNSGSSVMQIGPGRVNLNGSNTNWSSPLTIGGGVMSFGSAASVTSGLITLSGNGMMENSASYNNFTRSIGSAKGQVQWQGSGGFSARGSDFVVNVGSTPRVWGNQGFVPTASSLLFGRADSDHTVIFTTPISFAGASHTLDVTRGIASGPEARLTANLTNGTLVKTGTGMLEISSNITSLGLNISAGTLLLTGNNTQEQPHNVQGGVLRVGAAGALSTHSIVNLTGGGILEGTAAYTSMNRSLRWQGDGGFSATQADLNVNIGGAGAALTWGVDNFVPLGSALVFGTSASDHTVQFINPIDLNSTGGTFIVNRGTGTLPEANLTGALSDGTVTKNGAGALQISSDLASISGLNHNAGMTILTGNNTYTGATNISGGALRIAGASALSGSSNVDFSGGVLEGSAGFNSFTRNTGTGAGQVQWTGDGGFSATGSDMTVKLNGGGTLLWGGTTAFVPSASKLLFGSTSADHTVIFQNGLDGGGGTKTIQVTRGIGASPEVKIIGPIGSNGTFLKTGDGVLEISSSIGSLGGFNNAAGMTILSGTNSYGGQTTISGGVIRVIATGPASSLSSSSNLNLAGGVLELVNYTSFNRTLGTTGATLQWTDDGGFAARGTDLNITWPQPGAPLVWGTGNFVPAGSSMIFGTPSADHTAIVASPFSLGNGARTIRVNKGTGTAPEVRFDGMISSGSITKVGPGTMQITNNLLSSITGITNAEGMTILSGNNGNTGSTTVSGGILRLASQGALSGNTHVVLSGGGIIEGASPFTIFSKVTGTSGSTIEWQGSGGFAAIGANLTLYWSVASWGVNGFVPNGASLLFGSPNADHTVNATSGFDLNNGNRTINVAKGIGSLPEVNFTAPIFGTGALIKEGPGTLQFTAGNSYTGNTIINAGTLLANGSFALGSSNNSIVLNGGTLKLFTTGSPFVNSRPVNVNPPGGAIDTNNLNATFSGAISGSGSLTKSGAGSLTVQSVNVGPLNINTDGASGRMIVRPRSITGSNTITRVTSLGIGTGAALDLNDNDLIVAYGTEPSPFVALKTMVDAGYRTATDPNAKGIVSSTSQSAGGETILALFDNALVGAASWQGQTIGANTVVGKYTYFGDLNLDGQVTGEDYGAIDANLNTTPPVGVAWLLGDANRSGTVTSDDYTVVDAHLGLGSGSPLRPAALATVPEPGVLAGGVMLLGILWRRWRNA